MTHRHEIFRGQRHPLRRRIVNQREMISLRNQAISPALGARALPVGNAGTVNSDDSSDYAGTAKFRNDRLCRVHDLVIVAIIATNAIENVAI